MNLGGLRAYLEASGMAEFMLGECGDLPELVEAYGESNFPMYPREEDVFVALDEYAKLDCHEKGDVDRMLNARPAEQNGRNAAALAKLGDGATEARAKVSDARAPRGIPYAAFRDIWADMLEMGKGMRADELTAMAEAAMNAEYVSSAVGKTGRGWMRSIVEGKGKG